MMDRLKKYLRLMIFLALLVSLGACAAHGRIHRKPVPGRKKPCNCPDFGMVRQPERQTVYFYEPHQA